MPTWEQGRGTELAPHSLASLFSRPWPLFGFVLVLGLTLAGCRRPAVPGPTASGYVDLSKLTPLHPAWPQRDSLTALIASAHESHQHPIPAFRVPPDPSLPAAIPDSATAEAADKARMEQVIQARIERDLEAVQEKIEREVARYRETELATAEREVRLHIEESQEEFRQRYRATADRWADRIAPLRLQEVGLQPQPTDAALLSVQQREQRAQQLAAVRKQIEALRAERDEELRRLQAEHRAAMAVYRDQRLSEAEAGVSRFRQQRLAELETTRTQQQRQIRADLERSLRLNVSLPEITPPRPGPTAEAARHRAAATSQSAVTTMERYHEAARDVEHQLYVQREELEQMITDATRTAVLQLAQRHRVDVRFAPTPGSPDLTPRFAAWLRRRWPAGQG
jgi:hypothetical protein